MAPEPSWLEREITIDPESGFLSVQDWHVKGDLIIEGQVNQWLAQQLVVDDARIQVTWRQGGATVDSGLVIYNKDTSSEVSSLVYDVNGIWRAGGSRLFTDAYNPKLGGYSAASYPRKEEAAEITGAWNIKRSGEGVQLLRFDTERQWHFAQSSTGATSGLSLVSEVDQKDFDVRHISGNVAARFRTNSGPSTVWLVPDGGRVDIGGNVGTSNFASQTQGWRVTPTGVADFRHIYTDELQAKAFTADISQALVGSDVLTKSVAKLAQNWATTANGATSNLYVEELEGFPDFQVFAVGDRLLLRLFDRSGGGLLIKNIWATVATYVGTTKNVQRYTITVNSGGAAGHTVYAGSMILDYGTSGSGVIERTVLDAMGSPYSQVKTWVNDPSNPANYTIHNRTGNLDGIANASGFGFYGENTFLTKKLLVGDLTKAGQYMEYENGQLNIKGQITVTGGNAATKADVDAVQVGGRNLLKLSDYAKSSNDIVYFYNVYISPDAMYTLSDYNGAFERGEVTILDSDSNVLYTIWTWSSTYKRMTFTVPSSISEGYYTVRFWKAGGANAFESSGKKAKLELGNKATDWTPAPEDVPSAVEYLAKALQDGTTDIEGGLVSTNVLMVKDTNGAVKGGMSGLKSDNVGFWTGGTYQGAISNNANVIFRKDGSFSLAGGKISGTAAGALSVDGGVVTGTIESKNWDGTVGSRLDLNNGRLLIGDAIQMSGDLSEIQVKNRDTGLNSFKIGDFQLTPTNFSGAGVDVLLSSNSVSTSASAGSYRLNKTVYVSNYGSIIDSTTYIGNSLIIGGTYNLQTALKVTLSPNLQVGTSPFPVRDERFERISGNGIKMQLKNGNTVVWEQNISTVPKNGIIPLSISTSFQAVSPTLQLIITIDGEYQYQEPYGSGARLHNTTASIGRFDSSSRLVLQALVSRMEFSTKGMQAIFSSTSYFRCDSTAIEGRGTHTFISPDGKYKLRVSNTGIEKSVNGGSWTPL